MKNCKLFFKEIHLQLVDFKLEFGRNKTGEIILSDEVSPDTCRLWDVRTGEKNGQGCFQRGPR